MNEDKNIKALELYASRKADEIQLTDEEAHKVAHRAFQQWIIYKFGAYVAQKKGQPDEDLEEMANVLDYVVSAADKELTLHINGSEIVDLMKGDAQ